MIPTEYGMVFKQRTMQSVSIWLCVLVAPFLVGIVEFIMYGCIKYFRERYMAASINISNPQIQFCTRVTQYMQQKIENAKLHRVISTGTMEHRFEVLCKDRTGHGIRRDRVVQESLITVEGKAFCSCMKPKLLHLPCSHLIVACAARSICFTLLQQGSSCIHLGT